MIHVFDIVAGSHRIFDTSFAGGGDDTFDCLVDKQTYDKDSNTNRRQPPPSYRITHRYCRRYNLVDNYNILSISNLTIINHKSITFDDLRSMNITYRQLYDWYAPIDIIEDYISGERNGSFVNCSNTHWFGANCEYIFDDDDNRIFNDIIWDRFMAKYDVPANLSLYTNGTCYEMTNTNCESILCLDWREICDGKIDCKNGFDEENCQQLEMNACNSSSEYRCYDGQCIDQIVSIPQSKVVCSKHLEDDIEHFKRCYAKSGEECENEKCALLQFSCGDGYCYDGPNIDSTSCRTQRDQRYLKQMLSTSSLILFSHIHIIYNNTQPKLICYNQTLCPYLSSSNLIISTYINDDLPCHAFEIFSNETYNTLNKMISGVKRLVRSCSLLPSSNNYLNQNCPMYRCEGDGRCLSYHRVLDNYEDCINGDDEYKISSCPLGLLDRFTCDNETRCIPINSVMNGYNDCNDGTDESLNQAALIKCSNPFSMKCPYYSEESWIEVDYIEFDQICDSIIEYIPDENNNTDESECVKSEWPCDKSKSKCDRRWNCEDGHDELRCNTTSLASIYCNNTEHFCINATTGEQQCLATININDGIIDCIGSTDEREFCRSQYPYNLLRRYRCRNSTKCIVIDEICDCESDCPESDDETIACNWFYNGENLMSHCGNICFNFIYEKEQSVESNGRADLFCDLMDIRSSEFWNSHQTNQLSSFNTHKLIEQRLFTQFDLSVIWICNRGIYVRSIKDSSGFVCLCPDYYYGDRCQYQRKRIKLTLRIQMKTFFHYNVSTYKVVVLLVNTNNTSNIIISHIQFIYIPRYQCQPTFYIPLMYPIKEPYRSFTNNSIHIHIFDSYTLEHRYSRNYPLLFEFLPVQTIAKLIYLPETRIDVEAKQIPLLYLGCSLCSNISQCLGYDVSLAQDICVCSSNFTGRRCFIPFDPCTNESCSGHGKCQPIGINRDLDRQFLCLCDSEWFGLKCEHRKKYINVSLAHDIRYLSAHTAFLHLVEAFSTEGMSPHYIEFHRFHKQTFNLIFPIDFIDEIPDGGFIQFYEHEKKFDYYFLFLRKLNEKVIEEFSGQIKLSDRCRSINELFNLDILKQSDIRRVKHYQKPCLQRQQNQFSCFYDDYLMCVCMEDNHTDCFPFQTNLDQCDKKDCNNRGICIQDHYVCPFYSKCICEKCAYGSFCQFSTAGYTLSLDGIIGSHILLTVNSLFEQSTEIKSALAIIIVFLLFGIVLNILSLCTFIQRETHEVGCGFYLLVSSIIGLFTVIVLVWKIILLFSIDQSNASCSAVEFFLRWCPLSCEWLNTGVAVERIIAIKQKLKYSRMKSRLFAKWMIPSILIFVGLISMPELFFRRIIIDLTYERPWCILTVNSNQPGLLAMYSVLNILSFLIPLLVNLISAVLVIFGTFQSKQKTNKNFQVNISKKLPWKIDIKAMKDQISTYKFILITPVILALLSLPRLISTFIFVCTKLDERSIINLIIYLIGFLPTMAIPFAFICPSKTYRKAFRVFIRKIVPKCLSNLCGSLN